MTWQGSSSYVRVWRPDHPMARADGSVLEHRLVLAERLGRPLRRDEHVHHINRNPRDNRIENLIVLSNAEHWRRHWQDGSFSDN